MIRLLLHSAHGSLLHKVRCNVGYLSYPREMNPHSLTLHTVQAHMPPDPCREITTSRSRGLQEEDRLGLQELTGSRVQALDETRRAPPPLFLQDPPGLCAHLFLSQPPSCGEGDMEQKNLPSCRQQRSADAGGEAGLGCVVRNG